MEFAVQLFKQLKHEEWLKQYFAKQDLTYKCIRNRISL